MVLDKVYGIPEGAPVMATGVEFYRYTDYPDFRSVSRCSFIEMVRESIYPLAKLWFCLVRYLDDPNKSANWMTEYKEEVKSTYEVND